MSLMGTAEFKVGALVVTIGSLIALMSLQVSDDPSFLGRSKKAWFYLPDANGLTKGSAIRTAGIPVGAIKDIILEQGKARVEITVKSDVILTRTASVEMKANGILGDQYIEVYPGEISDPVLDESGEIKSIKKNGSIGDVMSKISDIADSLNAVSKNLKEAVSDEGTNQHILGRIVKNIEKLTANISEITEDNKEQIGEIVEQVSDITTTIDELINDESEEGFKKTWKKSLVRIDKSLKNIEEITTKVNSGEGTIGKLISDEKTADDVATTVESISGLFDTINKVSTGVDFNGYYLNDVAGTRSSVGIVIQPGLDRYYYLGLVNDPIGTYQETNTVVNTDGTISRRNEIRTSETETKITAFFAKNIYDFTFRGGLLENTGGLGIDYSPFYYKNFKASFDAFDFRATQLRAYATYKFKYGVYLIGGYNDILDNNNLSSPFIGAGLFITNDDLKLLLARSPF